MPAAGLPRSPAMLEIRASAQHFLGMPVDEFLRGCGRPVLEKPFTKTGVRARRDLVTKIFFAHYEPRLRDNEQRTASNRPLRGGPVVAAARSAGPTGAG